MHNIVVIDGELSLIFDELAEGSLEIPECADGGIEFAIYDNPLPAYTGITTVIPKAFESTVLQTANKSVFDNIEVLEIPYTEISNLSGGTTVSIG